MDDLKETDWPIQELGGLVPDTPTDDDEEEEEEEEYDDDDDDINKVCATAHLLKRSAYFFVLHRRPKQR